MSHISSHRTGIWSRQHHLDRLTIPTIVVLTAPNGWALGGLAGVLPGESAGCPRVARLSGSVASGLSRQRAGQARAGGA